MECAHWLSLFQKLAGESDSLIGMSLLAGTRGQRPPQGSLFPAAPAAAPEQPFVWAPCAWCHAERLRTFHRPRLPGSCSSPFEGRMVPVYRGGKGSAGSGSDAVTAPTWQRTWTPSLLVSSFLGGPPALEVRTADQLAGWVEGMEGHREDSSSLYLQWPPVWMLTVSWSGP